MSRVLILLCGLLLAGCSSPLSAEIAAQGKDDGKRLDLRAIGGTEWQRICFFGPYSGNDKAEKALGFAWDVESRTSLPTSDSINVVVLVGNREVVAYTEHSRMRQDFWRLTGQCFARDRAVFIKGEDSYLHDT